MTTLTSPPFAWPEGDLDRRRVVQCALSRVCGGCGASLGRPIAFVGTAEEVARNAFAGPPLHEDCAHQLAGLGWGGSEIVRTGGFEFVRPTGIDLDKSPRFVPNSIID